VQEANPLALHLISAQSVLEVQWPDGTERLAFELLRGRCPCSVCESQRRRGGEVEAAGVTLVSIEAFGANAVRLQFSDGHARGIYPFPYLRSLAASSTAGP
jgi:DUF971 family protein